MEEIKKGYKQTDIGVIPIDWEVKNISDVLTIRYGKDQKEVQSQNGVYPILGTGGLMGYSNRFLYNQESVLIGRKGTIDKPQYMNSPFWTVDTLFYTVVKKNQSARFIYYQFLMIDWYSYNEASGVPSLNAKTIANIEIPFPPTFAEQTSIATALSDVDALIAALDKKITKKQQIKQGTMQLLLTGKKRLPGFSGEWVEKKLGEIAEIKDGTHQTPHYVNDGIPFYSVESVTNNDFKKVKTISIEEHKQLTKKYKIEKGDVLMTRIGSIGVCKFINWDLDASFYVSLALLKFKSGFSAQYFTQYSKTSEFIRDIEEHSLQHATPKKINLGKISLVKIHLPLSFAEQTSIAQVLMDMDKEIEKLQADRNKYEQIKVGMMQQLLTGKIRLINENVKIEHQVI